MTADPAEIPARIRPQRSWRTRWLGALLLLVASSGQAAPLALDPETARILVEAVEAAAALDLYNARCRSDGSGRHTDNLNKQLVSKLRLTVMSVEDDLFPERNYRKARQRLEDAFIEALRQAGGCQGAKEAGLPNQLGERYRKGIEAIEALP